MRVLDANICEPVVTDNAEQRVIFFWQVMKSRGGRSPEHASGGKLEGGAQLDLSEFELDASAMSTVAGRWQLGRFLPL